MPKTYTEYQMYDERADPAELVNLAGRQEYKAKAAELLRAQLKKLIVAAGEPEPEIHPAPTLPIAAESQHLAAPETAIARRASNPEPHC